MWGENYLGTSPAVWEHRYLCYESGARVWSEGSLGFRVLVNLSHRFCLDWATMSWTGRPCLGMFLLSFETFLGGALRHHACRGYIVFWGTSIYYSLACTVLCCDPGVSLEPRTATHFKLTVQPLQKSLIHIMNTFRKRIECRKQWRMKWTTFIDIFRVNFAEEKRPNFKMSYLLF